MNTNFAPLLYELCSLFSTFVFAGVGFSLLYTVLWLYDACIIRYDETKTCISGMRSRVYFCTILCKRGYTVYSKFVCIYMRACIFVYCFHHSFLHLNPCLISNKNISKAEILFIILFKFIYVILKK